MRSEVYQSLYPDDLMLETFGKLNPSTTEKSRFYHDSWRDWESHAMYYDHGAYNIPEFKNILKSLGLRDVFDFQVRRGQVRFKTDLHLALVKLSGLERNTRS
jgi:hypothetical protein